MCVVREISQSLEVVKRYYFWLKIGHGWVNGVSDSNVGYFYEIEDFLLEFG